ncbi:tetratricopeptide repeat protein [Fuchsiella alkaliacetigena]|uniref:tetratricopeptide repeat protein n=1 Tax=Fuchsiella alkaliacetigena TaxID=957042 RepID=UPI00200A6C22|nr:tetratricopeptide repeat protein [Fuchsiella alkaliacetigena]MCK8824128.1 tetratricopeptide repeat protein [Fuchsiella alkaliacetigena]
MRKREVLVLIVILASFLFNFPVQAQSFEDIESDSTFVEEELAAKESAEEIIEAVSDNFKAIEDFRGSLISEVFLAEEDLITYQTNLMRNPNRSLVDNNYTFGQIRGTEVGRLLNAMPWIYLPPDYSLVQRALPITGQRDYQEPLENLDDLYDLQLLGQIEVDEEPIYLLELSNIFGKQVLWVEQERLIILRIEVFDGGGELAAAIDYKGYRELEDEVWLPNLIQVHNSQEEKILEISYQSWVVNDGLRDRDFAMGFIYDAQAEINELEEVVADNPQDFESRFQLAKLHHEVLESEKAVEILRELIEESEAEQSIEYYQQLAAIYEDQSKYQQALEVIEEALAVEYEKSELHFTRAELSLELQNRSQARNSLETAVRLEPNNERYLQRLFWVYRRSSLSQTVLNNAQNVLDRLIDLSPENIQYLIYSGDLYLEAGDYEQAAYRYQQAIQVDPEDSWGYRKLARCYEKMDSFAVARELFKYAAQLDGSWMRYEELADFYYRHQNYKAAIDNYQVALEKSPQELDVKIKLGKGYWAAEDEDEALAIWNEILDEYSLQVNDYTRLGNLFMDYELDNLAVATYKQGIAEFEDPVDAWVRRSLADIHANLAEIYKEQANYELAMQEYYNSLELEANTETYNKLGVLKFEHGNLVAAMELWEGARDEDLSNLQAIYNLAVAQLITEDFSDSKSNLEYIKRFDPEEELVELLTSALEVNTKIQELKEDLATTTEHGHEYKLEGDQLRRAGELNEAAEKYKEALDRNAYYEEVYFYLGQIEAVQGNYRTVEEIIDRFNSSSTQRQQAELLAELKLLIKGVK